MTVLRFDRVKRHHHFLADINMCDYHTDACTRVRSTDQLLILVHCRSEVFFSDCLPRFQDKHDSMKFTREVVDERLDVLEVLAAVTS